MEKEIAKAYELVSNSNEIVVWADQAALAGKRGHPCQAVSIPLIPPPVFLKDKITLPTGIADYLLRGFHCIIT